MLGTAACGDDLAPSHDAPEGTATDPDATGDAGTGARGDVDGGPPGETDPQPNPLVAGVDLDAIPLKTASFPFAVMAGDATATAVMLWTKHVGDAELWVQLEPEAGPKGMAAISRAVEKAEQGDGGFVHVDVSGLVPGTRYRYAFFEKNGTQLVARSALGAVRVALAPGAMEIVTFAGTSCTHQDQGGTYPVLADAAKRKVDFFLHGGDHVYTDAGTDATTLTTYRAKYAEAWSISGMRALHASTGLLTTWDDHEIANNWNPETFPKARLDAARRTFFEHRAFRRDAANPDRVWRSFVWGRTLEVIVLDARSERKPSTREAATAQFISRAQMDWLKQRLETSPAIFKFVLTSVPISNFPLSAAGEADKWEGYPAQREEILDFVEQKKLQGVWWLSGDLHFGSIGAVGTTAARMKMREVLMGPGGTTAGDPDLPKPQFERAINEKNYTLFKVDPTKRELTVTFVRGDGTTIYTKTYPA